MKQTEIWREAKRLHALGLAIHWLHPNSKRPVESGWTTGPKKSWDYLKETYRPGFNVGVRLGSPSLIDGKGYLTVIDVDVKSSDERHRKEALKAVKGLIAPHTLPQVRSGRGLGSRHYYCLTANPFKTFNPFQSEETIKAFMPSKSPSKRDLAGLTEEEIKKGWRFSRAWEISLYSDGRQVVLPPSVHPDTGKPYIWVHPLNDADSLPLLDFQADEPGESDEEESPRQRGKHPSLGAPYGGQQETVDDFEIDETLDIRWLPEVSDKIRALIVKGLWNGRITDDRSAMLLPAATALVSAGLDKNSVLTILSDRSTFLGECAFDHAKTSSRKRAAQWLWNYTVKRVVKERSAAAAFKDIAVEAPKVLDADDAQEQAAEIEGETNWRSSLEKTDKGKYRNTFHNCQLILVNSGSEKLVLGRDEFAVNDFLMCNTVWGAKKNAPVTDAHLLTFKKYCVDQFNIEFSVTMVDEVFKVIASRHHFHPVRDYIRSLEWDGSPRIETWLRDYAGAVGPEEYVKAISRKVLCALVKRVFEPGCKFDHVLILEGIQGAGKSTLLSNLTSPWFSDETLNIGDKDAVLTMQSKWLIELGELSALSRAEIETMKAFISRRTDRIRPPYGKRIEEFPRQCIFIGSTNQDEYLRDETGNRRFWPVTCGRIDFEALRSVRDQLFAEAYAFYLMDEPLYLETAELNALAKLEQERRGEVDEWLPTVRDLVSAETFPIHQFEMREVSKSMEQFGAQRLTPWDQKRIGKCLRFLGFEKFQEPKGARRKLWRKMEPLEPQRTLEQSSSKSPLPVDFY